MNNFHYSLHKLFLISMFIVCAIAVVYFVRQSAVGATTYSTSTINGGAVLLADPVNGVCSGLNETRATTKPSGNLCQLGTASIVQEVSTGWGWKCEGKNGGTSSYCRVYKYEQPVSNISPVTTVAPISTTKVVENPVPVLSTSGTLSTAANTTTNVAANAPVGVINPVGTAGVPMTTVQAQKISTENSQDGSDVVKDKIEISDSNKEVVTNSGEPVLAAPMAEVGGRVDVPLAVGSPEQQTMQEKNVTYESLKAQSGPSSMIVAEPFIVEAKNLATKNNPKVSGEVIQELKIENVVLNKKADGKNNVMLAGKAKPGTVVSIYIFSSDPVVIKIKADANGNWNYELDKELADGQHEAYVAVTDDAGKIISKSEPIAFVKTAQAASVIPMSELTGNESPIERSSQQYILMALVIMVACLAIALVVIGFLSHKRNLDEGIN